MLYNDDQQLEQSPVVANCCMNRERDLSGTNGYDIEIGFQEPGVSLLEIKTDAWSLNPEVRTND
jgi:hypothetical protein